MTSNSACCGRPYTLVCPCRMEELAEVVAERDAARKQAAGVAESMAMQGDRLAAERDAARAEVERLKAKYDELANLEWVQIGLRAAERSHRK